jgi:hypothetical protein
MTIFTILKRVLTILILQIGITYTCFSQNKPFALVTQTDQPTKFIRFFPNPATTTISLEFQKGYDRSYSIEVYNFMGKKVYDIKTVSPHNIIPLYGFYRGVYIFQLHDRNGKILESSKFQVVR